MATCSSQSTDEDGPSEFMITFNKTNFSEIESSASSSPFAIQNVLWQIVIEKTESKEVSGLGKHLGFYLSCKAQNSWSFPVRATLTVVSQKKHVPNFFRIIEDIFSSEENQFGYSNFMNWLDVIDPECGFIVDDTVKFQAHILANIPIVDSVYPNILENDDITEDLQKQVDGLSLLANQWDEDMVRRISIEVKDARNYLEKAQQKFIEDAIKRLKGDLKISIESAVHPLRLEISSVKNDLKVLLDGNKFQQEERRAPDFRSDFRGEPLECMRNGHLTAPNPVLPQHFSYYNSRHDDHTSRLSTQPESGYLSNWNERGSDCSPYRSADNVRDWLNSPRGENEQRDTNISLNEPSEKELVLVTPDENGQFITFQPSSMEELLTIKKKYPNSQIL